MAGMKNGSKSDVMVKLVLVFFIALLSFSVGTYVGKRFSDNQHSLALHEPTNVDESSTALADAPVEDPSQQEDMANPSAEPARQIASADESKEKLSDDEVAKLAKEFVADDASTQTTTSAKEEATTSMNDGSGEHAPTMEVTSSRTPSSTKETKETQTEAVEKVAPAVNKVAKEESAKSTGMYTVQVAAYQKEAEAKKMSDGLTEKGFNAFYVPAQVKGQTWYRVSLGKFESKDKATAYKDDLVARAKIKTGLVKQLE